LIEPIFLRPGTGVLNPVSSMPGVFQVSPDMAVEQVRGALDAGIRAFLLFGIPPVKDSRGDCALEDDNIVQVGLRALRLAFGDSIVIVTDECFCEYTSHGHCGILSERTGRLDLDNDANLTRLAAQCVSHARAGADIVAPSGMLDGMIGAIRRGLDAAGYSHTPIMSYAVKFASAYYGPFRDAAECAPAFGDRRSYQMDPPNADEALAETALDIDEGADMVMVKPAGAYLDVVAAIKRSFAIPVAAYQVSGEYAMVKAAADNGWIDGDAVALEQLLAIKRAGADFVLTYFAREIAETLSE
jgi:porphobilinogen synthase